jgi:fucose permease
MNDSVVGALIPYMEEFYNNSHSIMSLVFVGNAAGFIAAAFFTTAILGKIGRAKTLIVAQLIIVSAYVVLVCSPPYPLVIVS